MPVHQPMNQSLPHQQLEVCGLGHVIFKESCKACTALQKEWYSYLSRSGFEDIEKGVRLVAPTEELSNRTHAHTQMLFNAKRDYYQWASECLTNCSFDTMVDKLIWGYHAEGYTRREIAPIVGYENSNISRRLKLIEAKLKNK